MKKSKIFRTELEKFEYNQVKKEVDKLVVWLLHSPQGEEYYDVEIESGENKKVKSIHIEKRRK